MRTFRMVLLGIAAVLFASGMAQADPPGFKASFAARFKIGGAQIDEVISNTANPADTSRVFKFGEMSKEPTESVMEQYQVGEGQGWGTLAKNLGIKPGSPSSTR